MKLKRTLAASALLAVTVLLAAASASYAGNKRLMSVNAAKVLAERGLVESVYGLKIRASEAVTDMIGSGFSGSSETKTQAQLRGVRFDDVTYDPKKDVAKVTASVSLPSITDINGDVIDLKGKVFKRVAFATSTPESTGPLKALRAAEVDAYKQLAKQLVGFTLESKTKVDNFILTSDVVKTKVLATLLLAEVTEYGWNGDGDAYVKMSINMNDFADVVGQRVAGESGIVTVEGMGVEKDDYSEVRRKSAPQKKKK